MVSGPSSVGKSTFMAHPRCAEITGLPPGAPVVWPEVQDRLDEIHGDAFYHYNLLRPTHLRRRRIQRGQKSLGGPLAFGRDPRWRDLSMRPVNKRAVVLVASKRDMVRRALARTSVEGMPDAHSHGDLEGKANRYKGGRWARMLGASDLPALYAAWFRELGSRNIPYTVVDSRDDSYRVVDKEEVPGILADDAPYEKEDIEALLRAHPFEYHRVELPYGLHTPGQDRSATRDLVLPESLKGKSFLDVGSALGYFCFEAEDRGAERVVGVEMKGTRFRDALLLAEIRGSSVRFFQRDILEKPMDEEFDYVLLLNVVHHLAEPVRAMRQLARITRERLVIEFPTFADKKFRNTARFGPAFLYDRLPLIGVSSADQEKQTFVFAPPAIKRIMTDHEKLFERVEILRSPMPGRAIAVCHKGSG